MNGQEPTPVHRALDQVRPGARIVASPYCATPETLLRELGTHAQRVGGLTLAAGLLFGTHPYIDAAYSGDLSVRSWHVGGPARRLARDGLVDYVPCRAGDVGGTFHGGVDVVLVRVGPPDRHGNCSLGPSLSYTRAAIDNAALVIAEVDETFPRTCGTATSIPRSGIDVLVETDTPTCTYATATPTAESARIADLVLDLLPLGATLQVGIGTVSEAVAAALDPSDLRGMQLVGLANDAMAALLEPGRASVRITAVELMGTERLFRAAHDNPAVQMEPSAHVHDPAWLATLPRLVSVCSALQVDLTGQVASEAIEDTLVAGIGGSADFFEGAHLSESGLRIVALPSTTTRGASRIVRRLGASTPVTLPRHSVDAVVTEYGVAWLRGRTLRERGDALMGVAAPEHHRQLAESPHAGAHPVR